MSYLIFVVRVQLLSQFWALLGSQNLSPLPPVEKRADAYAELHENKDKLRRIHFRFFLIFLTHNRSFILNHLARTFFVETLFGAR